MTETQAALDVLQDRCLSAGMAWEPAWREPLQRLCEVVADGARATNLVGDASPAGVCAHVVEALVVADCARQLGMTPLSVGDIGAGAGLAALTYALAWPQARVFAVEPRRLRADFIRVAAVACELGERVVVVQRSLGAAVAACELPPALDLVDARAVWPAPEWMARAKPLVATTGLIALHLRGADAGTEALLASERVLAHKSVPGPRDYLVALARP